DEPVDIRLQCFKRLIPAQMIHLTFDDAPDSFHRAIVDAPTESAHIWKELIEDIHARGVSEVLRFISDGLAGIKTVSTRSFQKRNTRCVSFTLHATFPTGSVYRTESATTLSPCIVPLTKQMLTRLWTRLSRSGKRPTPKSHNR